MGNQLSLFDIDAFPMPVEEIASPSGYKGLSAFHKYWGKKPIEPLLLMIDRLSNKGDTVLDPFLGGGLLPRAAVSRGRSFIGIDINPCSIELAKLFLNLPQPEEYAIVFRGLESQVAPTIQDSYKRSDGTVGSHYFWDETHLKMVWEKQGRGRIEHAPNNYDLIGTQKFETYSPQHIRPLTMFQNSRINAREGMDINDLFTGRALRNIDLLLEYILPLPEHLRRAFLLTLTSASGQMSKMVFAISKRGKATGAKGSERIEVGSWAIGFWCPKQHFEINVWNCFSNRANRFLKVLRQLPPTPRSKIANNLQDFYVKNSASALCLENAVESMKKIKTESVSLILTDPPHSDRVPYLELSDFWNAILQYPKSNFSKEIVISNAKGRNKNAAFYVDSMQAVMRQCLRVLKPGGFLCIQFNAKDTDSWKFLQSPPLGLSYCGCFPLEYSARSLVQDNRKGAMKHDYALIYNRSEKAYDFKALEDIPGWSKNFPKGE